MAEHPEAERICRKLLILHLKKNNVQLYQIICKLDWCTRDYREQEEHMGMLQDDLSCMDALKAERYDSPRHHPNSRWLHMPQLWVIMQFRAESLINFIRLQDI